MLPDEIHAQYGHLTLMTIPGTEHTEESWKIVYGSREREVACGPGRGTCELAIATWQATIIAREAKR